jgi:hypothetical protein
MPVRTTVDIPDRIHDLLRLKAAESDTSIRSLIVSALEQAYVEPRRAKQVKGPLVVGKGKLGPLFPKDENPHDLVFS